MHQTFYLVFAYLSVKSFYHHCCCRSSMQLANRLDIQLRSVVEWQELFHPDAILLRQRYINFIFLLCCLWNVINFVPVIEVEAFWDCSPLSCDRQNIFSPIYANIQPKGKNVFLLLDNSQTTCFHFITLFAAEMSVSSTEKEWAHGICCVCSVVPWECRAHYKDHGTLPSSVW